MVETVAATHYVSAVFSFLPHSIGSPVKGSRQLCCRGVEKTIRYQLLALRCGQRSLVGNGFIRSVVMVLPVVPGRAGAKTVSASALMRNYKFVRLRTPQLFIINYSSFIIHWGGHRPPHFCLPLRSLRGRLFRGAFTLYEYIYCVSPTGGAGKTTTCGTGKPVPYMIAVQNSSAHLRYARQLRFSPLFRTGFTQEPYR